jgi:hypothetical protein
MATIHELIDSRKYSRDQNGNEAGSRAFVVLYTQNEAGARDEFYQLADHRVFPGCPGMILDRVDVEGRNGNTVFAITASYSTFAGFRKREEIENGVRPFFGWSYSKETVELPFTYLVQTTGTTEDEAVLSKFVATVKTVKIMERRVTRILKTRYETSDVSSLDIIADQDRKLHRIKGRQYLFMGADVQQDTKDPKVFIITYSWQLDRGTYIRAKENAGVYVSASEGFNPVTLDAANPRRGYIIAAADPDDNRIPGPRNTGRWLVRPPYSTLDLVPANIVLPDDLEDRNAEFPPQAVAIYPYDEDDDGWRSLPGMIEL